MRAPPQRQPHFDRLSRIGSHLRLHNVAFVPLLFFLFLSSFYSPPLTPERVSPRSLPFSLLPIARAVWLCGTCHFPSKDSHVNLSLSKSLSPHLDSLLFSLTSTTLLCSREVSERASEANSRLSPFRYFQPPRSILSSFFFSFHHLHPPFPHRNHRPPRLLPRSHSIKWVILRCHSSRISIESSCHIFTHLSIFESHRAFLFQD